MEAERRRGQVTYGRSGEAKRSYEQYKYDLKRKSIKVDGNRLFRVWADQVNMDPQREK